MARAASPQFALPRSERSERPRYAKAFSKLSRFLARNLATKKMHLVNALPLVTFTFDDASASACDTGALLLEKYKARATYYISGAGCGMAGYCGPLATTEQLRALCLKGHEIGCHTYSHTDVTSVGYDVIASELERNRLFLEGIHSSVTVRNFAYPYGELSFGTKHYLEGHFASCRSLRPGVNVGRVDLGALKSTALQDSLIDRQEVAKVVAETVRRQGWLIFTSHDVDQDPSKFGVSPDLFAFALQAAREAGCQLVSVREALQILNGTVVYPGNNPLAPGTELAQLGNSPVAGVEE